MPHAQSLSLCKSYLTKLTQQSGILLSPTKQDFSSEILYDLQSKECVVFQLSQSKNSQMGSHVENCVMSLVNSEIGAAYQVQFHMRGTLQESILMFDCVAIHAAPGYVCTKKNFTERRVCTSNETVVHNQYVPAKNKSTNIFTSHIFEPPVSSKSVILNPIAFFGQTESWIDMKIDKEKKIGPTEMFPFSVQYRIISGEEHIHLAQYRLMGSYTFSLTLPSLELVYMKFSFINSPNHLISSKSFSNLTLKAPLNHSGFVSAYSPSNYERIIVYDTERLLTWSLSLQGVPREFKVEKKGTGRVCCLDVNLTKDIFLTGENWNYLR